MLHHKITLKQFFPNCFFLQIRTVSKPQTEHSVEASGTPSTPSTHFVRARCSRHPRAHTPGPGHGSPIHSAGDAVTGLTDSLTPRLTRPLAAPAHRGGDRARALHQQLSRRAGRGSAPLRSFCYPHPLGKSTRAASQLPEHQRQAPGSLWQTAWSCPALLLLAPAPSAQLPATGSHRPAHRHWPPGCAPGRSRSVWGCSAGRGGVAVPAAAIWNHWEQRNSPRPQLLHQIDSGLEGNMFYYYLPTPKARVSAGTFANAGERNKTT